MECDKIVAEMPDKVCAHVSLKRMFRLLLDAQSEMLNDRPDKAKVLRLLSSVEHDLLMMNDKDTCIDADLFR